MRVPDCSFCATNRFVDLPAFSNWEETDHAGHTSVGAIDISVDLNDVPLTWPTNFNVDIRWQ